MVFVALGDVGGRDGQLGGDLVQRRLAAGQTELVLKQGRLGGILVRVGEVQPLHGINQLLGSRLGLLHQVAEIVEHDGGRSRKAWEEGARAPVKAYRDARSSMQRQRVRAVR